ncbi:MAG: HisS family protein [Nanoarchaeota archaeon]|nr:HisS family protein [Nanoarchaeota archaeon]
MTNETVKGFKDYTEEEAMKKAEIKKLLVRTFENYGFEPAETPIVEYEEFVKGENEKDEAVSDIFKLRDKGNRALALRYEFTFQLKRIANNKKLPYRRYQIGEVFRDEPVTSNRFRQFTQCDIDVIGSTVKDEAEVLAMTKEVLINLGVEPVILVNNRKLLNEILESEKIKEKDREKVLVEIDKFGKISDEEIKKNLKKYKAEKVLGVLKKGESYFKKFPAYKEVLELIAYCLYYKVKVLFSPTVIRGLSYYNGSVFEVKAKGISPQSKISSSYNSGTNYMKETIVGGGSYLVNGTQSTGISFGLERLSGISKLKRTEKRTLVLSINEDKKAIELAQKLRSSGKNVVILFGKPTKALDYANAKGIQEVIFLGKEEVKKKKYKIKNMITGRETFKGM